MRSLALLFWALLAASAMGQVGEAQRITDSGVIAITLEGGESVTLRPAGIELADQEEGRLAMDAALAEGPVELVLTRNERRDRFDNLLGDVRLAAGQTLTGYLVGGGFAIAYSWPETRQEAARLLPVEQQARNNGEGLWGSGALAIRSPDPNPLALHLETIQIIEGRVISIGDTRDRIYLNFGFDYRTDFTVSVDRSDIEVFTDAGIDLTALEGHQVRVRGWLRAINGPAISLDHPERLEILTTLSD